MAKKILLIESDGAFAQEMSAALETRGLQARVTADGKEGLDLARVDRPDLIVLCVELPKMSGYSICNKLKKDDALRTIPLVIISAEATTDTFDQHRKLKTHADDYLIKPFAPAELLKTIAGLVELPSEASSADELVTLDDVEELESLGALELDAPSAPPPPPAPPEDDDLRLLDDAFDSLASDDATAMTAIDGAPAAPPAAASAAEAVPDELDLALEVEPPLAPEATPSAEVDQLGEEADAALAALGADDPLGAELPDPQALLEDEDGTTPSGADLLHRAGLQVEPPPPPAARVATLAAVPPATSDPAEAARADGRIAALERELAEAHAALKEQQAGAAAAIAAREVAEEQARVAQAQGEEQARAAQEQAEESAARATREETARRALEATAREAEQRAARADARAAQAEESGRAAEARTQAAEQQLSELRREAEAARHEAARTSGEADQARERAEELARELRETQAHAAEHESALATLRPELEAVRSELTEAHGTAASTRAGHERELADRERRVAELEAQLAKHEERVVKAYQKIKGDEKIREKARKALAIALQLLEERSGAAPASPADVQPRRE